MEINKIPSKFLDNMKEILGDDYINFYNYLSKNEHRKSVTINYRANNNDFIENNLKNFEKFDLTQYGFFIPDGFKIGSSLLNHAGIIYSQDYSAMLPVELLNIEKDDFVLDMCSAPGGKSIQILNKLNGSGLVISNEVVSSRASILFENLTKMGNPNFIITNSFSKDFKKSKLMFDKILIDAPCSGEGLFAKSQDAIDWKEEYILSNAERQYEILEDLKDNLKVGGTLVYSTCTFNLEENEKVIAKFLNNNSNFEIAKPNEKIYNFLTHGFKIENQNTDLSLRCYPHKNQGSGQFMAVLKKTDGVERINIASRNRCNLHQSETKLLKEFFQKNFCDFDEKNMSKLILNNGNVILNNCVYENINNLKVLCAGVIFGEIKNNNFKPNHSLFKHFAKYFKIQIELDEINANKYIKGEQISVDEDVKGYGVFMYHGFALGGFKATNGMANNLYPKSLREN